MKAKRSSAAARLGLILSGAVWLGCVGTGFAILAREQYTPVASSAGATDFPRKSSLALARDKPTLVIFLHPQCPCSRATLHQLDEILAETGGRLAVRVVFTIPANTPSDFEEGDLLSSVKKMRGVEVLRDEGGAQAEAFGVKGSGHALLYATNGKLLFSGGITDSRGHEGDNVGQSAVVAFVLHGRASVTHTPVFGCSLL